MARQKSVWVLLAPDGVFAVTERKDVADVWHNNDQKRRAIKQSVGDYDELILKDVAEQDAKEKAA